MGGRLYAVMAASEHQGDIFRSSPYFTCSGAGGSNGVAGEGLPTAPISC
jgi:hypothetical protein